MARAFAEKGVSLALADIDAEKLAVTSAQVASLGVPYKTWQLDVSDKDAVITAVAEARETFGSINIVCANAGVSGMMTPLESARVSDWDWVIDVNLKGSAYVIQACLPYLMENPTEAHIVITSSISGLRVYKPSRGQGMYNTTKFGLVGLGEALKVDLEQHGIGVSILCPGVINTNISHSGKHRPDKYGGAYDTNGDHELAKAAGSGTDPLQFGRWVVKAIEQNDLYVITHPQDRQRVEARHKLISDAFDASDDLTGNAAKS
jgi:NAD(P)-dependent dehydrogenase (short-subunit alcohol dehydrogenase family)